MAEYLALQVILGKLSYATVVARKPDFKNAIDIYLTDKGRQDLITN